MKSTANSELSEILKLEAEVAKIQMMADRLGSNYVKKYCPYKVGMIFIARPNGMNPCRVRVEMLKFDVHSKIRGLAILLCRPVNSKGIPLKRNVFYIKEAHEIDEIISPFPKAFL